MRLALLSFFCVSSFGWGAPTPAVPVLFEADGAGSYSGRSANLALRFSTAGIDVIAAGSRIRLSFEGANLAAPFTGESPSGFANYLSGSDPAGWRPNVPQYRRVRAANIFPGVDMVLYGSNGDVEQDLIVAPGADPTAIVFRFPEQNKPSIDRDGNLLAPLGDGNFVLTRPAVYQVHLDQRTPVNASYVLGADGRVGIRLAPYDSRRPLVIDPVFRFTKSISVGSSTKVEKVWLDSGGNVFIAGTTTAPAFPVQSPVQASLAGSTDAFLMKLSGAAGDVVYATYLGGAGEDLVTGLMGDSSGNIYLAGHTTSTNFPVTTGAFQSRAGGGANGYALKLSPNGATLVYSTYLGGSGVDRVNGLFVDSTGAAFLAGGTESADFPVVTPFMRALRGQRDGFLTKLNPSGTAAIFSTFIGGQLNDEVFAVSVSPTGRPLLTGSTESRDFPTTEDAVQAAWKGGSDAFLVRLAPTGNALDHGTFYGGAGDDAGTHITLAPDRQLIIVGGTTNSRDFPKKSSFNASYRGGADVWFGVWQLPGAISFDPPPDPVPSLESLIPGGGTLGPNYVTLVGGPAAESLSFLGYDAPRARISIFLKTESTQVFYTDTQERTCSGLSNGLLFFEVDTTAGSSFGGFDCGIRISSGSGDINAAGTSTAAYIDSLGNLTVGYYGTPASNPVLTELSSLAYDDSAIDGAEPVSAATGVYYAIHRDVLLRGPLNIPFTRTYATNLDSTTKSTSVLGTNWSHNYEVRLAVSGSAATLFFHRGIVVTFRQSQGRWTPVTRAKHTYQLVQAGTLFRLLDPSSRLVYTFDGAASGRLESIENSRRDTLRLIHDGGLLRRVEDGKGRSLAFTYSGSRLAGVADHTGRAIAFSYTANLLTAYKDMRGFETTYSYSAAGGQSGLMVSQKSARGNTIFTNTFDAQGRVFTQLDGLGNRTTLAYNTPTPGQTTENRGANQRWIYRHDRQLPTEILDGNNRRSLFTHDANSRMLTATNGAGERFGYTYHAASGYPESVTLPDNSRVQFTYRDRTRDGLVFHDLASVVYPDGSRQELQTNEFGNLTRRRDRAGREWGYRYNDRSQLIAVDLPTGGAAEMTYNEDGAIASHTLPTRGTVRYGYDSAGRVTSVTRPDGTVWSRRFNEANHITSHTDENELSSVFEFDENGRQAKSIDRSGAVSYFSFDANDRLKTYRDPTDTSFEYGYDDAGRLNRIGLPDGSAWRAEYDAAGNATAVVDPTGARWTFSYDAARRLAGVTTPTRVALQLSRDSRGRVSRTAAGPNDVLDFVYDAMSRVTAVRANGQDAGRIAYNPVGLPASVTVPGDISAAYEWSPTRQLAKAVAPDSGEWLWEHDSAGAVAAMVDPAGNRILYERDPRGLIRKMQFPNGSVDLSISPVGRITKAEYSDGTSLSFDFDANGRLVSGTGIELTADPRGVIASSNGLNMSRDSLRRITEIELAPGKTVKYRYDAAGRLAAVTDWLSGETIFVRDAAGRVTQITRPNGTAVNYTYDGGNRLTKLTDGPATPFLSMGLVYNADGTLAEADREAPLSSPSIDFTPASQSFEFLPGSLAVAFEYDALGHRTADSRHTYSWDLAGRLTGVAGETAAQFLYDANGLMTSMESAAGTQSIVWNYATNVPSPMVFRGADGDSQYNIFTPAGRLLHTISADGQRLFHHFDEQGHTRALSGDDGAVAAAYLWTPYGVLAAKSGDASTQFGFMGQYGVIRVGDKDLYNTRLRFYDAASASFLSRDSEFSLDPRRWNLYQYAYGNPVAFVDFTGGDPAPAGDSTAVTAAGAVKTVGDYADKTGDGASVIATTARLAKDGADALDWTPKGFMGGYELGFKTVGEVTAELGDKFNQKWAGALEAGGEFPSGVLQSADAIKAAESSKLVKTLSVLDKVGKAGDALSIAGFAANTVVVNDKINKAEAQQELERSGNESATAAQARAIHELYKAGKISGAERIKRLRAVNAEWFENQSITESNHFKFLAQTSLEVVVDGLDTVAPPFVKDIFSGLGSWAWGTPSEIPD